MGSCTELIQVISCHWRLGTTMAGTNLVLTVVGKRDIETQDIDTPVYVSPHFLFSLTLDFIYTNSPSQLSAV